LLEITKRLLGLLIGPNSPTHVLQLSLIWVWYNKRVERPEWRWRHLRPITKLSKIEVEIVGLKGITIIIRPRRDVFILRKATEKSSLKNFTLHRLAVR
jgi:hypothetical protein